MKGSAVLIINILLLKKHLYRRDLSGMGRPPQAAVCRAAFTYPSIFALSLSPPASESNLSVFQCHNEVAKGTLYSGEAPGVLFCVLFVAFMLARRAIQKDGAGHLVYLFIASMLVRQASLESNCGSSLCEVRR